MSAAPEPIVASRVRSVADRLRAIDSREALHAVLLDLAPPTAAERARWSRTQVRHFLPSAWRAAADAYFDGERLRPVADIPSRPAPIDAPSIAEALAPYRNRESERESRGDADQIRDAGDDSRPPRTPDLAALLSTPAPVGNTPVAHMLRALREEMKAADAKQPKRYRLSNGRCVRASGGQFVYQFDWSSEPDPHAPGEIRVDGHWFPARIGEAVPGEGRARYELYLDQWFGPELKATVFRIDPTYILRIIYRTLHLSDAQSSDANTWAGRLLDRPDEREVRDCGLLFPADRLNARQSKAVRIAAGAMCSYVWGPPGTGKTRTVGSLVAGLVAAGRRVLIISPYNVAVDEAVLAIARAGVNSGIVRPGRAGAELRRLGLDLESQLEDCARKSGLLEEVKGLVAARIAKKPGDPVSPPETVRGCLDLLGEILVGQPSRRRDAESEEIADAIAELRDRFKAPTQRLIADACVVASTMALSFVWDAIYSRAYDHVVIDEASVVRAPEALLAALKGAAPVTFFGDPRQLPPVVLSDGPEVREWFARTPFSMAGIANPQDARGACVMLDKQHRMAPPIRSLVSELFYEGQLRNAPGAPSKGQVIVVDTARSGARATPKMVKLSNSKENTLHRGIVAEVLRCIAHRDPSARALVLSPFVAQKRAYRHERATSDALRDVRFETIHTSQGSERDIVVLDLVLAGSGVGTRSRMLDERANRHLANLLNVAVSRARYALIIVGDLALVRREYPGGLLDRLLERAIGLGVRVDVAPRLAGLRAALSEALRFTREES